MTEKILGSGTFSKEEWEEFGQLEKVLSVISKFKNGGNTVGDYVKHDEMFKQYPFLRDVKLEFFIMNNKKSGYYDGLKNTIFINKELKIMQMELKEQFSMNCNMQYKNMRDLQVEQMWNIGKERKTGKT